MEFNFSFPAIRGVQAGKEFYSVMCPLEVVSKLFNFYNNEIPEESRAQRILNEKRIPEIKDYIINNLDSYVFSSLTASIDGDYNFIPYSENNELGVLKISMNSNLLVNDGQHRKAAIDEALREEPSLKNEHISVVLFVDHGLIRSQQMFSDLNRHAVNVSNSLSILYDHRNPVMRLSKDLLSKNPRLFPLIEKSNNSISKKSKKIFTLSSFYEAIKKMVQDIDYENDFDFKIYIYDYWNYIFDNFNEWKHIISGEVTAHSSRQTSISTYGVILEALGILGNEFYKNNVSNWNKILDELNSINWSRNNHFWLHRFVQSDGTLRKSTYTVKMSYIGIKQHLGIPLSEEEMMAEQLLRREQNNG